MVVCSWYLKEWKNGVVCEDNIPVLGIQTDLHDDVSPWRQEIKLLSFKAVFVPQTGGALRARSGPIGTVVMEEDGSSCFV